MQSVTIDRTKRLKEEAHLGHNRWHPDIPPIVEVDLGKPGQSPLSLPSELPDDWSLRSRAIMAETNAGSFLPFAFLLTTCRCDVTIP